MKMISETKKMLLINTLVILTLLLIGCRNEAQVRLLRPSPIPTEPQTATATATLTPAPMPSDTATPPATATSTPTASPTPTLSPTPLQPLTIEWLRRQTFPSSEIVIEEILEPGSNYQRYTVSYLSEGSKIYALLTVPTGEKPASGWPVIVFNHGFIPPATYRTTERYVAYVDTIARNGYIVFRSDYRGHGNSEGEATGGYSSPAYTIDVLNAVAAIKQYPDTDPNRIGMWGHSMGGQVTLRSMVTTSDIEAGVIWAGVVGSYPDLLSRWRRPDGSGADTAPPSRRRWREALVEEYGSPEDNPAFWDTISPNSYVAEISGPVQLHHATTDTHVPVEFSEGLYAQLLAAGRPVEYYHYESDDHDLTANFTLAMERTIAFFNQYVKGE